MNIGYALLISFLAGISTLLGAFFIFLPISKTNINKYISFSLAFSIAIMIGISLLDLLPESIIKIYIAYNNKAIFLIISLFMISFLLIKLISKFLEKYENNLYKLGILSMITLIIHNLPEGIITFLSSYTSPILGLKLSFAIALHNIPEGIAIAVPIYYATGSKKKAIVRTVISGLSEPIGALFAYLFLAKYITDIMVSIILIIVAGIMITLAIEELLPQSLMYHENKYLIMGLIIGIIILILSILL